MPPHERKKPVHEELTGLARMARSMIETDSPHMDSVVAINQELFDEHLEAGHILAERVDTFTRSVWTAHVNSVPMPTSLASRWRYVKSEEAMAALGNIESVTTDVDAIRRLVVDVGVVASFVFQREGRKHYSLTGE